MADNVGDVGRHRDLLAWKFDEGTPVGGRRSLDRSPHRVRHPDGRGAAEPRRFAGVAKETKRRDLHHAFNSAGISLGGLRRSFAARLLKNAA